MEASATVTQAGTASNSPDWLAKLKQTGMVPLLIGGAAFIGLVLP